MPHNRFQLLLSLIHFASQNPVESDHLSKVIPLLQKLEDNFTKAKIPEEKLVVYETMIPFQGRLIFRQYNPGKTHHYGIKLFKL